ncbi:MAG: hypothetical protein JJ896_17390 [Rhodothermales bacterium]|nr:hypothetical protein [Rhodothermales bacterium]MBO6781436.1 hypothetical protein [Rhodothermales bacterium]
MTDVRKAIVEAASRWRHEEHPARVEACARTLEADNRFTAEALAFAVNQQMELIDRESLDGWLGDGVSAPLDVGVIEAGNVPLAGLQDYLAVVGLGHRFIGSVSSRSPWLLPAFAEEAAAFGGPEAQFVDHDGLPEVVDALIASGTDETIEHLTMVTDELGVPALLRGNRYSVAVVDGRESEDERLGLAEDVLLHEGLGCRNVAIVFGAGDIDADPYFEALSVFRGTFPAHARTSGSLKMQQAFLDAVNAPHAYGEGLVYLVSRGDAEPQVPGHLRWVPVDDVAGAELWIRDHEESLQVVSARSGLDLRVPAERVALGEAQRPTLDWHADGRDTVAWLRAL